MGWLFCIALFITYLKNGQEIYLISSALFAIAGEIGRLGTRIKQFIQAVMEYNNSDETDKK